MRQDEIDTQQTLLQTARTHLGVLLQQQLDFGIHTPAYVTTEIVRYRKEIARLKQSLRSAGMMIDDQAQDEPQSGAPDTPAQPRLPSGLNLSGDIVFGNKIDGDQVGGSKYTFNAPITSGAVNIGGEHPIDRQDVRQGDSINISNLSGAILNVKSRLDHVQQQIGALPDANQEAKAELGSLVAQLNTLVQQVPPAQAAEAVKLAIRAEDLLAEVQKSQPDQELIEFNLQRLTKSAAALSLANPAIQTVALRLVERLRVLLQL